MSFINILNILAILNILNILNIWLHVIHQGGVFALFGGALQLETSEVQHCSNRRLLQVKTLTILP